MKCPIEHSPVPQIFISFLDSYFFGHAHSCTVKKDKKLDSDSKMIRIFLFQYNRLDRAELEILSISIR